MVGKSAGGAGGPPDAPPSSQRNLAADSRGRLRRPLDLQIPGTVESRNYVLVYKLNIESPQPLVSHQNASNQVPFRMEASCLKTLT